MTLDALGIMVFLHRALNASGVRKFVEMLDVLKALAIKKASVNLDFIWNYHIPDMILLLVECGSKNTGTHCV